MKIHIVKHKLKKISYHDILFYFKILFDFHRPWPGSA